MLFFGVFLRETARPVAKSRTNLAQIQKKNYQTAGPIDTKFGKYVQIRLGMEYAKPIEPQDTRGHFGGGGLGVKIQKSGEAVKRLDRLAPHLVHVCGFVWEWT